MKGKLGEGEKRLMGEKGMMEGGRKGGRGWRKTKGRREGGREGEKVERRREIVVPPSLPE